MTTITVPSGTVTVAASTNNNYAVFESGELVVDPGVTVSGVINVGDGGEVRISGTTLQSVVTSEGRATIGGTASNVVVDGGTEILGAGTTSGTIILAGSEEVAGGESFGTRVGSDGLQAVDFTSASNTIVQGGGEQLIEDDGVALNTVIQAGGLQIVGSGVSGTASANTVNAGGEVMVDFTGISEFGTISGFETVSSGGESSDETVASGGELSIGPGGLAQNTNVTSGGTEIVEGSGAFGNAVISSGGLEEVFSSANLSTTIVGGTVELESGFTGGFSVFPVFSSEVTFDGGGTLRIDGTMSPTIVINNFSPGDTINLAGVTFDPKGSVALGPPAFGVTNLQISENGQTFDLLLGSLPAAGLSFFLTSGAVGTDVQAHFKSDTSDLNSDGTSDILLQNSSGNLSDLFMQNGMQNGGIFSISNPATFGYSVVHDSYSQLALTGDFNGDGTADILLQNSLGNLSDWLLNTNGQVINGISIGNPTIFGYNVVGTGDFNGDGTTDILLQNSVGNLSDWIMKNGKAINGISIGDPVTFGFNIVGTGDFNGDGTTDILLQNSVGTLSDWLIKNSQVIGAVTIGNPAVFGYHVVGTGDFNGDGTADILLQNSVGNLSDWLLNKNGQVIGAFSIGNPTTFGFNFIGTGDFNGDGTSDILLQNSLGTLSDWIMKNGHVSTALTIGNPATVGGKVA